MEGSSENPVGQLPVVGGVVQEQDHRAQVEITDLSAIPGLGSATPSAPIPAHKAEADATVAKDEVQDVEKPSVTNALEAMLGGISPPPTDEANESTDIQTRAITEVAGDVQDVPMENGDAEPVHAEEGPAAPLDSTMMDYIPPVETETAADATMETQEAEFEVDSSPYESSSDDSSDSSSSEEDSDDEDAYQLLDPAEQARILMEGDGNSDDEGGGKGGKSSGGQLRTKNEVPDEIIPKPDVAITPTMTITELGTVTALVENMALITASTSGEFRVLESGSVLCLADRSVVGVVSETLGRVQQPLYCVRFTNAAEMAAAGMEKGTRVFYSEEHSTYVFTEALKAYKGSDASNLHDEEVGDEEVEFSDDEAEMEHKRRLKAKKLERRGGGRGGGRGGRGEHPLKQEHSATAGINYDDDVNENDDDGPYKPLARPSGYADSVGRSEAPEESLRSRDPFPNSRDRGRGGGERGRRGRGDRDRGRGRGGGGGGGQDRRNDRFPPAPADAPQDPRKMAGYNPSAPFVFNPAAAAQQHQQQQYPPQPFQFPQAGFPQQQQQYGGYNNMPQHHHQQHQQHQQHQHQGAWPQQVPAGAFLNPAFFGGGQQVQQGGWTPGPAAVGVQPGQFGGWTPPPTTLPLQQQQQLGQGQGQQSPEAARALAEAQEQLRILRERGTSG